MSRPSLASLHSYMPKRQIGGDGKSIVSLFDRRYIRNKNIVNDHIFPFWKEDETVTVRYRHIVFKMTRIKGGALRVESEAFASTQIVAHPKKFVFELFRDACTLMKIRKQLVKDRLDSYSRGARKHYW